MAKFTGGKLVVLKKDGTDGIAFKAENSSVINVGSNIRCEIRPQNCENIIGFHFKLLPEKFGRVRQFCSIPTTNFTGRFL